MRRPETQPSKSTPTRRGSKIITVPSEHPSEYAESVLDLVEQIPPGRVMSYGAIAEILRERTGRGSARTVGTVMARYGGGVPWHRVVASDGRLPPGHEDRARARLLEEGTVMRGQKVSMADAEWWPGEV